jgi:dienelactone hydrolase
VAPTIRAALSSTACALLLGLAPACTMRPATRHARPALPIPPAVATAYRVPGPVVENTFVPIGTGEGGRGFFRGVLTAGAGDETERTEFNLVLPKGASADAPSPIALALPILGGGPELMWVIAGILADHGWAVAWTEKVGSVMQRGQRGHDLEAMFRRTVIHNRMVLEWARTEPRLDGEHPMAIGVSMGGMVASVLLAVEPRVCGAAVVISGGDLPQLIPATEEGRVRRWADWRAEADGMPGSEITRELERVLVSDPARLAACVETEEVLMVSATLDTVIPRRNQDLLWEAFGRPQRMFVPLHHYTSALALLPIMDRVHEFLSARHLAVESRGKSGERRGLARAPTETCDDSPPETAAEPSTDASHALPDARSHEPVLRSGPGAEAD